MDTMDTMITNRWQPQVTGLSSEVLKACNGPWGPRERCAHARYTTRKWLGNRRKNEIARPISHLVAIRFLMGWSNPDEYQRSYRFELEWDHPNLQNHSRSTEKLVVFSDLQADSIKILSFWVKSYVGPFSWCQIIYVKNWKWCLSFLVSPKYDQKPSKSHLYSFNIFMYLLLKYISIYAYLCIFFIYCFTGWFQPLWKIWKSVGMIIPNIWKVIKFHGSSHHQPDK